MMPDLTTIYQWHCDTAEDWSTTVQGSKGDTYHVVWNQGSHKNQHEVQYDYSCTCPAYKFGRGGYCKHIDSVRASGDHCKWMQFHDGGDAVEKDGEHYCPECGSGVRSQAWGV
jgi:hypothetical protein